MALIVLFAICYVVMNQHYDELARYPHVLSEEERVKVLNHLDTDEINMLISSKIEPDQFLPYIEIEGFDLSNTLWYDMAFQTQKEGVSEDFVVRFINKYKQQMNYSDLKYMLSNYSFNALIRFFDEGDLYQSDANLIANPANMYTLIENKQTLYTYEPSNLVSVGSIPHSSIVSGVNDILVKQEVLAPLTSLYEAASDINGLPFGDMKIVAGYLSYEDQIKLLDLAKDKFKDEFSSYWDEPGHSEYQLGYTIQLLPNELQANVTNKDVEDEEPPQSEEERQQEIWLKDNAYKFGFIVRYPKNKEDTTGKKYQPYTLRYVGKDMASDIHSKNLVLDKVNMNAYD